MIIETASDLRAARKALGLTGAELARVLRLGSGGDRTVRRWEAGDHSISGPVAIAIEAMLEGYKPQEVVRHD
jgi:transcriptional regulator with XRE-family HTH domain